MKKVLYSILIITVFVFIIFVKRTEATCSNGGGTNDRCCWNRNLGWITCGDDEGSGGGGTTADPTTSVPSPTLPPPHSGIFVDVPPTYWAFTSIETLYKVGITSGCAMSPLRYCPTDSLTRAQMAVVLLRAKNGVGYSPPAVGSTTGFTDVPTSHLFAAWIKQFAAEGITSGCGTGIYCPEDPVTRAQMAVFLLRAKNGVGYSPPAVGSTTGFTDVPTSHLFAAWIKQLVAEGITSGCTTTTTYCPENPVTRDQAAVFIIKAFNISIPTATPPPGCTKKIKGDADCDDNVTFKDYFYYVQKASGGSVPTSVNADFNVSGAVDDADRIIVVNSLLGR